MKGKGYLVGVVVIIATFIVMLIAMIHFSNSPGNTILKERIGWRYVELTQEVTPASIIDDTFFVSTHVWVRGVIYSSNNMSSEFWDCDKVPRWKVEDTKRNQENRAEEVYWKCVTVLRGWQ